MRKLAQGNLLGLADVAGNCHKRASPMSICTRFAPSPTGRLHLGHALAARVAHDLARRHPGGRFLLRFEDIDGSRVREAYYDEIATDLRWLSLVWDGSPMRQTTRSDAYRVAFERLLDLGVLYPCFCTRREIQQEWAAMVAAPHGPDGPAYPGTCRQIASPALQSRIAAGHAHAWRLNARHAAELTGPLRFHDLRIGTIEVDAGVLGDVVIARRDIGPAYHLAVVVDDAYQEVTHVTRGEDLLASTHVQRLLQALLGLPEPCYLHHELVRDEHGQRLAKRCDALALATLRDRGLSATDTLALTDRHYPL